MIRLTGILVAALLVAACGDTTGPLTDGQTDAPTAGSATIAPSADPSAGGPSGAPSAEPSSEPSSEPSTEPSVTPGSTPTPGTSPDPNASPTTEPEAACTGSDDNRAFFAAAAVVMDWDVYCAVLPSGWFVQSGQYRQANGGFLEITYSGSGGRTLALREGAFCGDPSGCVPAGPEIGAASFGAIEGTLISGADGSWAVVVARGQSLSWLAVGSGMDETAFRALAGALHLVALPGG